MTRTRTLIIIGCFMLALAIIAALELRTETSRESSGQMVTGALSKAPSTPIPDPIPTSAPGTMAASTPVSGGLHPLDNGTLRPLPPDENQPLTPLPPAEKMEATSSVPARVTEVRPGSGPDRPASAPPLVTPPRTAPEPTSAALRTEKGTTEQEAAALHALPPQQTQGQAGNALKPGTSTNDPASKPAKAQTPDAKTPDVKGTDAKPTDGQNTAVKPAENKTEQKTADVKTPEAKPRVVTTNAPEQLEPGQKAIVWTHLEQDNSGVIFRITGAQALEGKGFELGKPDRYVVDLTGDWAISLPKVPNNALLSTIRAGRQGKDTRLVFDLKKKPSRCQIIRSNPKTLEIRIR